MSTERAHNDNLRVFSRSPQSHNCETLLTVLANKVQMLIDHIESLEDRIDQIEQVPGEVVYSSGSDNLSVGKLQIDHAARRVFVDGHEVPLSPTEYKLIFHLAMNAGKVVLYRDLARKVSGIGSESSGRSNLKVYIGRLRSKLNSTEADDFEVQAVRGVGYRLVA
jgi:DNA-binding response OmpR family regulator